MGCEVPECTRQATESHHILSRKRYGEAAEALENVHHCCGEHHTLTDDYWHNPGRDEFARRHELQDVVRRAEDAVWKRRVEMNEEKLGARV